MDTTVSIVLSKEESNYRKLAQVHYGLTDEEMIGRHVHHNPPRYKGGRNIPEHLYVYSPEVHDEVHGGNGFALSSAEGGRRGGKIGGKSRNKNKEACRRGGLKGGKTTGSRAQAEGIGFFGLPEEVKTENRKKAGRKAVESGQLERARTPESCRKGGEVAGKINNYHINKVLWRCLVCGAVSTAAGLTHIQKARGIDRTLREKVYTEDQGV
jgi:general stress protein YciG